MDVSLLETIDRKRKELDALLPMSPENEARLERKFRLEFNYNSNHIEGNTLTYGETKMLLLYNEVTGKHTYRELEEMKASDLALKTIKEYAADKNYPLTESTIRELNKILLVEPYWKDAITTDGQPTKVEIIPGNYKQQANGVKLENGEFIAFASPQETLIKMPELVNWFREEEAKKELPLVALAATLHHQFVSIHPFDDGNGRISRLLMNYVFYKNNLPPVVIKSADKDNYLRALRAADSGDLDSFIDYIAEQLIWSLDLAINCAKGEEIEEAEDWKKQLKVLKFGLEHKGEIKEKISVPAINTIITEVAYPLKTLFEIKLKEISDLFITSSCNFSLSGEKFLASEAAYKIYADNTLPLIIQLSFIDFKNNGFDSFNIYESIFLNFSKYDYDISVYALDGKIIIYTQKAYHQILTQAEQTEIVNKTAKELVHQIQEKLKQA